VFTSAQEEDEKSTSVCASLAPRSVNCSRKVCALEMRAKVDAEPLEKRCPIRGHHPDIWQKAGVLTAPGRWIL
jgi:hypothetical protein